MKSAGVRKFKIKLSLEPFEIEAIKKACKFHKMKLDEFIEFAVKRKIREQNPNILQENKYFLYTAKEERALRRVSRKKES